MGCAPALANWAGWRCCFLCCLANSAHVRRVPLAFSAEILDHVAGREQDFGNLHRYRFCQHHRIVDRDVDVQVAEVAAVEPFLDVHGLTVRVASGEPRLVVVSVRIHDERIAFPVPGGVTHPRRERILRQFAAVGVDLAESTVRFIEDSQLLRGLENRERPVEEPAVWHSGGQTVGKRRDVRLRRLPLGRAGPSLRGLPR